ncbi:hypothetical protein DICVIV_13575 [Dictyocaulus viviparus]|uniref:Uncharacterized protein n=1 Tax=Dictyocaulus viviparus TaxID=29172 RepID=A0A0D8XDF9_DICVI|nr:hypothetical protein DICVIV_13575 [Dictyocaulus viviparus]
MLVSRYSNCCFAALEQNEFCTEPEEKVLKEPTSSKRRRFTAIASWMITRKSTEEVEDALSTNFYHNDFEKQV